MGTFTATTDGNWNASATWGNAGTPAVEGVDYPGPNDSFSIPNTVDVILPAGTWPSSGGYLLNHASSEIQAGGSLTFSDLAYMNTTGDGAFTADGKLQGGSVGSGITGHIFFTPATDGGAGLVLNGSGANAPTIVGLTKDHYATLDADIGDWATDGDAAYDQANLAVVTVTATPTGWKANDVCVVEPTGRTYSHWDVFMLSGDAADATLDVDGWNGTAPVYTSNDTVAGKPAWNHQGAGTPTQARGLVWNLTRSFKIASTDAAKRAYITIGATATVRLDYVEGYSLGSNTGTHPGILFSTTTGSATLTGTVIHDGYYNFYSASNVTSGSVSQANCIGWLSSAQHGWIIGAMTFSGAGAVTLTSCLSGNIQTASRYAFNIGDVGSTFPGCRAVGCVSRGFYMNEAAAIADGILDNTVSHSNGDANYYFIAGYGLTTTDIASPISWRSATYNYYDTLTASATSGKIWLTSPASFGAGTGGFLVWGSGLVLTSPNQVEDSLAGAGAKSLVSYGGTVSVSQGSLNGYITLQADSHITVNNATWTNFAAPTFTAADAAFGPYLLSFRHNTAEDDHRGYFKYGNILSEATVRHTASGLSWRFTPTGGVGTWFRVPTSTPFTFKAAVDKNVAVTLKAWVKLHASYDGTAKPRIVALGGLLQGVAADVVGDSHSGGADWEQLTVALSGASTPTETGVIEFTVEGAGTAGGFYVDDVTKA